MQNAIYLRHRQRIVLPPGDGAAPDTYLATLLKNVEAAGFTASTGLLAHLRTLSFAQLGRLYLDLVPALRSMVGADAAYQPMYPNFPDQVMSMPGARLYMNAVLHYLTRDLPVSEAKPRQPLRGLSNLRVIEPGDNDDFRQICTRLLAAKSALSEGDRADVVWFFQHYGDQALALVPDTIPVKENVALLATCLLRHTSGGAALIGRYITTATDVLRLAVALSDGDVSLATSTKFRSFSRAERRMLLDLLEQCSNRVEDMLRHREPWKRLGERLHPGGFQARVPHSAAAFALLRSGQTVATFRSQVEQAISAADAASAVDLLSTRPGELARRLDHLLRLGDAEELVTGYFGQVAAQVSTPVLLQVLAHFAHRNTTQPLRTFFPKGDVAKAYTITNELPMIDDAARAALVAICRETLVARFGALPPLGRVFVDPRLRDYPVPLAQRSASKALRTIARGSRLPLDAGTTVRFFLWWKEGLVNGKHTGTVDIDLSAVLYDADWRYREHISYTNLKSTQYQAAHSGDIVTAPHGACEFIDLDIASVVRYGGRYVVMAINAFTRQPFCDLPECYAGWMLREAPMSGEIFEPRTVQNKIDVAANTRVCLTVILDLAERSVIWAEQPFCDLPECYAGWMLREAPMSGEIFEPRTVQNKIDVAANTRVCLTVILDLAERSVIWADLALRSNPRWHNNVEGNQKGMLLLGQAMTALVKPDLYELFTLHAAARGTVTSRKHADVVFAPDGTVTPFDIGVILAEYV